MKKHIIGILAQLIHLAIAGLILFLAWNEVVPELFHYQEITIVQAVWMAGAVRVLTIK